MLSRNDMAWLVQQLAATAELLGSALSEHAAALMAEDLAAYDRQSLAQALTAVSTNGHRLTLKAVLDALDAACGRLDANEAWALAFLALDERETVVWTDEIAEALHRARPLMDVGDKVGARMAFIAAYERITAQARANRKRPVVDVSIGWSAQLRNAALDAAVAEGRITQEFASQYRPQLEAPAFNPVAMLTTDLSEEKKSGLTPELKARIEQLRSAFREREEKAAREREEELARKRAQWDASKQRAAEEASRIAAEEARESLRLDPPPPPMPGRQEQEERHA